MEQSEKTAINIHITEFIQGLKSLERYPDEVLALVQEDLEYGLSEEQVKQYYKKKWSIGQMKIYSKCLRDAPDYVKKLVDQISAMITHIEFQEKRYDALAEHLKIFESTKKDEDVRDDLVKQNAHQATVMNEQQNQIMQANSAIARYRTELEQKEKEMKKMQDKTEALEEQIRIMDQRDSDNKVVSKTASTVQPEMVLVPEPSIEMKHSTIIPQNISGYGVPIYYTVSMVDSYGRVVQTLPIERTEKKTSGITNLFSKLGIKKKSRQDIVKLVASGDLVPDQLVQLKSAIERGLTESQLVELINNNVSAEKMKEIIEIAVLENAMYEKE